MTNPEDIASHESLLESYQLNILNQGIYFEEKNKCHVLCIANPHSYLKITVMMNVSFDHRALKWPVVAGSSHHVYQINHIKVLASSCLEDDLEKYHTI